MFQSVSDVCDEKRESLAPVSANMCAFKDQQAQGIVMDIIDMVAQKRGIKNTFEELLSEEALDKYINSMRVPDWVLVYFKLKACISDSTWQTAINFTSLGRTGVSCINIFLAFREPKLKNQLQKEGSIVLKSTNAHQLQIKITLTKKLLDLSH